MTPNRPTEQLNEQHLTALIAEYGTGNAWVMYYDSFKWSAGGFLIAGVFIFWGALFAADSPTELFTPATLVVTAVTEPRWNLVDTAPHRRRRRRAQRRRHHPTPSPAGESRWSGGDVLPHDGSMSSFISHTTVDCHNAYELSEWWKQVLGYVDVEGDPNEAGDEECMIRDPESGHQLLFIEVADSDLPAKRIHFDLRPRHGRRDEEVERLRCLGAGEIADQRGKHGPGTGWVVFADPEGNQLCVLRSEAEMSAAPS